MSGKKVKLTTEDIKNFNADTDRPLHPRGETAVCGFCKNEFYTTNMRECPHPVVRAKYGTAICAVCCRKCKFGVYKKFGNTYGGTICTYKK